MNELAKLKSDTFRQYGHYSLNSLINGFLTRRTFRVIVTTRLCQFFAASQWPIKLLLPFCKLLHKFCTHLAGMDFPWNTQIGYGLTITHGWGLVMNKDAKIGSNVTLFHGVTLGRRDKITSTGERIIEFPILEDDVWVGPHAIIVGGITIGKGSRIAGGTFVTENIPPYSIVSGNPYRIIKANCIPDVMNPAPRPD